MAEKRITELIGRWRNLRDRRDMWASHWEDLARVQLPRRIGFITQVTEGDRRTEDLYDSTGIQSARSLANQFGGKLRPEGKPWFFLKAVEGGDTGTDEAKEWLADTQERLRDAFDDPRARFRQATGEVDLDLVVFGTGVMFIGEQVGRKALLFQSSHLKDGVPVWSEEGNLDGMFRSRRLTLRQAEKRFGRERLAPNTQKKFEQGDKALDEKIEFLWAVLPREEGHAKAKLARNLPIANVVVEVEAQHEVMVSGFHEMPYICPRRATMPGDRP